MFIKQNDFCEAVRQWNLIPDQEVQIKISHELIEKMIEAGRLEEVTSFISQINARDEKDETLKEASLLMGKYKFYDQARYLIGKITDSDVKEYTLSNMANLLSRQNLFAQAKEVASSISDRDFREDAVIYIVKAYMRMRHIEEAIQFVDSIKNPKEKIKPAKIIEISQIPSSR